jgi:dipeptidyl aminopeptidase/acylaminoacyl peptidase
VVSCQNSLLFAKALKENKVPFELHIFPRGGHGLSLANEESNYGKEDAVISEIQQWPNMFARWIKLLFD